MGEALREAWLWVTLAFVIGLVVGYIIAKRSPTARVTAVAPVADSAAHAPKMVEPAAPAPANATVTKPTSAKPAVTQPAVTQPAAAEPAATKPTSAKASASRVSASKPAARKASAKPAPVLDLAAARAVLGATVKLDDLKLIEGIGPKTEGLLKADGLTSWRDLSRANVERLQGILDAAGPRYNTHNPGSWPSQAGLLADGKWDDFKELTDKLRGGR